VFHKYRVRLHPERLEVGLEPKRFRNTLMKALRQEGVEVVLWQVTPVPAQILFQQQQGYGRGCPWHCHNSTVRYQGEEFPETSKLLDNSLVVGSQSAPLAGQDIELMHRYADAFEKILADQDTLIRMARNAD
jgi:perosamine synthetase